MATPDLENYYQIDISNNKELIDVFNKYINIRTLFYKTKMNQRIVTTEDEKTYTIYDGFLKYRDTDFGVNGYIYMDFNVVQNLNGTSADDYKFHIWVDRDFNNTKSYIELVRDAVTKEARHGDRVQLNYYKVLNEQLITHTFYNKSRSEWIEDAQQLESEFFSPHKRYLFDVMQHRNRNGNWSNLILHGEPGTGKSSFVYRLATKLQMSIISVDLAMYIDRKRDLYSIFHGNEFNLPYGKGQKFNVSQNCIIILEEFDSSIEKIKQLENIFLFKKDTIHSFINRKTSEIEEKVKTIESDQYHVKLSPLDFTSAKTNNDIDPNRINNEITDIVKTITDDHKSDILRLRDLLELFQGPVPVRDRILVATTNNFDQIRDIIPALFRPGRLTPIYFTYIDWDSFKELCKYYFKVDCTEPQFSFKIPTSQITELAIKYVSMGARDRSTYYKAFISELVRINSKALLGVPGAVLDALDTRVLDTRVLPDKPALDTRVLDTRVLDRPKPIIKIKRAAESNKAKIFSEWMNNQIGSTKTDDLPDNVTDTDEYIRQMAINKSLENEQKNKKLHGADYATENMLNDYMTLSIATPQHDGEY